MLGCIYKTDKDGGLTALDQDTKNTSLGWGDIKRYSRC